RAGVLQGINVTAPVIAPGDSKNFSFNIASTFGIEMSVAFEYDSNFEALFSAPTVFPTIPANGNVNFNVPITCALNASAGDHDVIFQILSGDTAQVFGFVEFDITVVLGPPPPDPRVDHFDAIYVDESTMRICQLTGRDDPEGKPHPNDTTRFA